MNSPNMQHEKVEISKTIFSNCNYYNLQMARHTALSDTQYLISTFAAFGYWLVDSFGLAPAYVDEYAILKRRDTFFQETWTRRSWLLICGAIEKYLLTYLLTYVYILTLSAIYMPIQERLYGFPGLFTDTSKHIGFFTFKFLSRVAR